MKTVQTTTWTPEEILGLLCAQAGLPPGSDVSLEIEGSLDLITLLDLVEVRLTFEGPPKSSFHVYADPS